MSREQAIKTAPAAAVERYLNITAGTFKTKTWRAAGNHRLRARLMILEAFGMIQSAGSEDDHE